MKKNKKQRSYRRRQFPVIGTYIDARTQAKLNVVDFIDDLGAFKFSSDGLITTLKGCRFQLVFSNVKSKRRFYKLLQPYLMYSSGFESGMEFASVTQRPLIFGLLKMRKGKVRKFVMFESANELGRTINIMAAKIDNLLYLDLLAKSKQTP